jgi:hypothetical protein
MVIWLLDIAHPGAYVWSFRTNSSEWTRHAWSQDPDSLRDRPRYAGWVTTSISGEKVMVFRIRDAHQLWVGSKRFDLSKGGVYLHRSAGLVSRFMARQGSLDAKVYRVEVGFLPDLLPIFRDPWIEGSHPSAWFPFEVVADLASSSPDRTAGPMDFESDLSQWVRRQ